MGAVASKKDQLPVTGMDEAFEGMGTETADATDYAIPFIQIAQGLSPQLDKNDAKYIKGLAKEDLFNTVTGETYPDGVRVIPVKYEKKFLEFNLRENGGGIVSVHETYDPEVLSRRDDKNRSITDDGTQIVETRSFYCLVEANDGTWYPAMVGMKSTGIKKAKQWMSMISGVQWQRADGSAFQAPAFARMYKLGVAQESRNGNTWGNFTLERLDEEPLQIDDQRFQQAHAFYKSLDAGDVNVDYAQTGEGTTTTEEEPPF